MQIQFHLDAKIISMMQNTYIKRMNRSKCRRRKATEYAVQKRAEILPSRQYTLCLVSRRQWWYQQKRSSIISTANKLFENLATIGHEPDHCLIKNNNNKTPFFFLILKTYKRSYGSNYTYSIEESGLMGFWGRKNVSIPSLAG